MRLEANEPDAFLELEPLGDVEAEAEPDLTGELLFAPAQRSGLR